MILKPNILKTRLFISKNYILNIKFTKKEVLRLFKTAYTVNSFTYPQPTYIYERIKGN